MTDRLVTSAIAVLGTAALGTAVVILLVGAATLVVLMRLWHRTDREGADDQGPR